MANSNVDLIQKNVEMINSRRFDLMPGLIAPGFVLHDLASTGDSPRTDAPTSLPNLLRGIPDLRITLLDAFGDGDRVAARIVFEGTHQGPLLGHQGTGKRIAVNELQIFRVAGGKIAEMWQLIDLAGLMIQVGAGTGVTGHD